MKKRLHYAFGAYDVASPILVYYVLIMVAMYGAGQFLGATDANYNIRKLIGVFITLPVIYIIYYKPDITMFPEEKIKLLSPEMGRKVLFTLVICILVGIGINNLTVLLIPITESEGYVSSANALSGSVIAFQLLNSALFTPILEEMLYRGIVFRRLDRGLSTWIAVCVSALVFGLMHFNIVQGVFAAVLGVLLALIVKVSGRLSMAVLGHIVVNFVSIMRNNYGWLSWSISHKWWNYLLAVGLILVGSGLMYAFYKIEGKKNEE